jgi:hypothetical protein
MAPKTRNHGAATLGLAIPKLSPTSPASGYLPPMAAKIKRENREGMRETGARDDSHKLGMVCGRKGSKG